MNSIVEKEKQILEFWEKQNIFQRSIRGKDCPNFVFYEGPPTANAEPGIHHIEARAFKDIICRYKNMKGFRVLRKAGWDTHGLPVEIEVEKKLGLKNKKEIEDYGVAEFNKKCQDSVWRYKKSWEDLTKRIGYWIDMDNPYITYSNEYIESVWWILKQIWDKGLLFQDYKIAPFCPRCGTTLSSHELAQGYQKIKEPSVYLKFSLRNQKNTYLLVWTTTPWTLPGNVAIAVNPNFKYVKVQINQENYILAQSALTCLKGQNYKELEIIKGEELVGLEYQGLYKSKVEPGKKIYQVLAGDFVTAEEGTGLVHIAPAFGEDDYNLIKAQPQEFAFIISVNKEGKMVTPGYDWDGLFVKKADPLIIKDLDKRGILFKQELYEHDYPFCWRCGTPLIYYAQSSWFIKMTALKQELLDNNEKINWVPEHIKQGRFGEWLREVKDWNLSRERYWGTPLPIWQCQSGKAKNSKKCNHIKVIGSIKELEELSGQKIDNPHRPFIDKITFKCDQCDGEMKRVPEVIDCWFDSGSMPLAQQHYPFENKELVDKGEVFPADFICESLDQTRGWFYTLLAIATALGKGPSYKNVVVTGMVLDEKGKKMSKSKGNVIIPEEVIQKFGADCLRFYFYTLNQVDQPKKFSLAGVKDLYGKFFLTLENCLSFLKFYSKDIPFSQLDLKNLDNILDQWIISETHSLIKKVTDKIDNYDVVAGARLFLDFVENLSNWYIRCSRPRFQRPKTKQEKQIAVNVLRYVLKQLARLLAPFTPFMAESIYQDLKTNSEPESVHLTDYPQFDADLIQSNLKNQMQKIREIVALALAQRAQKGIKLRQPLNQVEIPDYKLGENLLNLIKQEINVKKVIVNQNLKEDIKLDTKITPELAQEGRVREIIRTIQQSKKEFKVKPHNQVKVFYQGDEELNKFIRDNQANIEKQTTVAIEEKSEFQELKNQKIVKIKNKQLKLWLEIS